MRFETSAFLLFLSTALASPAPRPQGKGTGADSCASEPLTQDTWAKLELDEFLATATANFSSGSTNNVQALAASFGAPNFFCGLDSFCNAGQPCLPIQLPQWYVAIAIQNWNNYMNSLNTAITFASSIISLKLPEIVTDVFPDPVDNITPLKSLGSIFGSILGVIPLTGTLATGVLGVQTGLNFVLTNAKPPAPTDKFLTWSNIGSSVADVVSEYQSIISNVITQTLDSPINNPDTGIRSAIRGGAFLGVTRNFTQDDIQKKVIDSVSVNAISLALQAQKVFVTRTTGVSSCTDENDAEFCFDAGGGSLIDYALIRADDKDNAVLQNDIAKTLMSKYGFTKETMLKGPADCMDENEGKQLVNNLDRGIAADPTALCSFSLLVCDRTVPVPQPAIGIVPRCRQDNGLDV